MVYVGHPFGGHYSELLIGITKHGVAAYAAAGIGPWILNRKINTSWFGFGSKSERHPRLLVKLDEEKGKVKKLYLVIKCVH